MRPCTKRSRRLWAATEARALGYGGIALAARATGLSPATIGRGLTERDADVPLPVARVRKPGAGRKRATKTPQRVRAHDFVIPGAGGKAIPYGVYDPHRNEGWVSVGIDHDMATFAVRSIRRWWQHMRRPVYRDAVTLLITADAGPTASTARRSRSARSFCSTSAVQPDECPRHVDQGAREAAAYHRGDESGASQWPTAEAPAAKTDAAASRE